MSRLWSEGEIIRVETTHAGWPRQFVWHDQWHRVQRIVQYWRLDTDWWSEQGQVSRDYMAIITHEGLLCVVFLDLLEGTWRLAKIYD